MATPLAAPYLTYVHCYILDIAHQHLFCILVCNCFETHMGSRLVTKAQNCSLVSSKVESVSARDYRQCSEVQFTRFNLFCSFLRLNPKSHHIIFILDGKVLNNVFATTS